MKIKYSPHIILIATCLLTAVACRKPAQPVNGIQSSDQALISEARNWYQARVEQNSAAQGDSVCVSSLPLKRFPETVYWDKAITIHSSNADRILLPVAYTHPFYVSSSLDTTRLYNINAITYLQLIRDATQQWKALLVTSLPDSSLKSPADRFTGMVLLQDGTGSITGEYLHQSDGVVLRLTTSGSNRTVVSTGNSSNKNLNQPGAGISIPIHPTSNRKTPATGASFVEICYSAAGYNYLASDPDNGNYWQLDLGCKTMFINDAGGGTDDYPALPFVSDPGPGGSGSGLASPTVVVTSGHNTIGNIHDYNKCFDNIAGSSRHYTVTVCVDQPIPGSRDAWGLMGTGSSAAGNLINVGHTFLILQETGPSTIIKRNIGFYPGANVYPGSPSAPSQLNNDNSHEYNISLTIDLDNSEFFLILAFVEDASAFGNLYNLNSNNCTTFVLKALAAANIKLPATVGTWVGGAGYDPGDLGEDIRAMTLQPNMIRNTTFNNHPNIGICY